MTQSFKYVVVLVAVLGVPYTCLAQECSIETGASEIQCLSCTQAVACDLTNETPLYSASCGSGTVCNPAGTGAPCVALTPADTTDQCGCADPVDPTVTVDGLFVDPYGPNGYFECIGGTPQFTSCGEDAYFSVDDEACVPLPSCDGKVDGNYPIIGNCGSFLSCQSNPITGTHASLGQCLSPTVFNFALQDCEPVFNCSAQGEIGEYRDIQKCNLFRTCFNVTSVDSTSAHCCSPGTIYDPDTHQCIANDGSCNEDTWNECLETKYENELCQSCNGKYPGYRYSTWLTCTELYWECNDVGDGTLEASLQSCVGGTYYIEQSGACEIASIHPECTESTLVGIDRYLANV